MVRFEDGHVIWMSRDGGLFVKIGVLLINTGTADAPTKEAIRPYLTEFLMDPAIIGAPLFIRRLLVKHIVKNRPERTVAHYEAFWTPEGSPFMLTSKAQCEALSQRLNLDASVDKEYMCALSMRYGSPSICAGLEALRDAGCEQVVLLPLYPQNVKVCAGTCLLAAHDCLREMSALGWAPEVFEVKSFHDHPAYRAALVDAVRACWEYKPGSKLIVSFHSTMMHDIKRDDTYFVQATETKDWLAKALGVPPEDAILGFQSRFDSRKWLKPFTEQILKDLVDEDVRDVCVITPGFVADNIETAIEVNRDLRQIFLSGKSAQKRMPGHVVIEMPQEDGCVASRSDMMPGRLAAETPSGASGVGMSSTREDAGAGAFADSKGFDANEFNAGEASNISKLATGERSFTYVPALGCADGLIEALADCVHQAGQTLIKLSNI